MGKRETMNPFSAKLMSDLEALSDDLDDVMLTLSNPSGTPIDRRDLWIVLDRVQHELGRARMHIEGLAEKEQLLLDALRKGNSFPEPATPIHVRGHVSATTTKANSTPFTYLIVSSDG